MWTEDKLDRKKYADFLCALIKNSDKYKRTEEEESYVIALDSPWGTGKSWFLKRFEQYLKEKEGENGIRVIHYSAWANDFWDNAFLPLLYALYRQKLLKEGALEAEGINCVKNVLKLTAYLGKEVGLKKIETVLGEDAAKILQEGLSGAGEHMGKGLRAVFQDYEDFCQAYETVRKMLEDCLKDLGGNGKIVIVVDELDRCRPDFAVQTLEVVKHLFNVKGLVFLFAVDMEQLGCVIRGIYGESLDARTYLNRMFHYVTHLPAPDTGKYIRLLYQEKISNFKSGHQHAEHTSMIADFTGRLAEGFGLSLRELDTIWKNYLVLYDYKLKDYALTEAHLLYLMFLVIKYRIPNLRNYMDEKGYTTLSDMPQLEAAGAVLEEDSMLLNVFRTDSRLSLRETEGWLFGRRFGMREKIRAVLQEVREDRIIFCIRTGSEMENRDETAITEDTCFSGALYQPDFAAWERIKGWSLMDYMKEQLELFEFSGE